MPKYRIPFAWSMFAIVEVEAENVDDAIQQVEDANLPEGSYVEGSFEIDHDYLHCLNKRAS
jgi:hypothetical protein